MKKILSILFLLYSSFAFAGKFYIDIASGNNTSGTGTSINPWQTLAFAVTQVGANDTIYFANGTYNQPTTTDIPVGVSLMGNSADTSAVRLTGSMTTWLTPIISLASATLGTNGNQTIQYIKFDGQDTATSIAIKTLARSNISIKNCSFTNFRHCAVIGTGHASFFPNDAPAATLASGILIRKNKMINCGGFEGYGYASVWYHSTVGLLIDSNVMENMDRVNGTNGWALKLLDFHYGTKVLHNTLKRKPFHLSIGGVDNYFDFAIESADNPGLEIAYNNMQGSIDANRQWKGTYPYSVYIHHNNIGQPSTPTHSETAIVLEYNTKDAIIDSNNIFNVNSPIFFSFHDLETNPAGPFTPDTILNLKIRGNYFKNIGTSLGSSFELIQFHANYSDYWYGNGIEIHNNTMICNPTYPVAWGISMSNVLDASNISIKNNIIVGTVNNPVVSNLSNNLSNVNFSNNLTYLNGTNTPGWFAGNPSSYTNADNLIGTNPLIVADTLSTSSPAIDAGINVGMPFSGSAPDIGYREYGTAGGGNMPPSVTATATPSTMQLPLNSSLLAATATDADGSIVSYVWSVQSGPGGSSFTSGSSSTTSVTGLTSGTYVFRVTVTDNLSATAFTDVTVTVSAAALLPNKLRRRFK